MKKTVFIVIYILGILSFSSCKSTSKACGLSENVKTNTKLLNQLDRA